MADHVNKSKDKQSNLDSFVTQSQHTPKAGYKRNEPSSSPDNSSPSMQQAGKKLNLDNQQASPNVMAQLNATDALVSAVEQETVLKLSDVVCATLRNDEFINSLIPLISQNVIEHIAPKIKDIVHECLDPHLAIIKHNKDALIVKDIEMSKQNEEIQILKAKLDKLETRIEEQEQYSRRTSLRFNNVPVPRNGKGVIIKPIDTDALVLGICKNNLKVDLSPNDIGRSHPIGEMREGKISIIVRFLSYRPRQLVFSNKRKLKGNPNKTFIAENLTKHRYDLLFRLNNLRLKKKIDSFWTHDGSIIVKETTDSRSQVVRSMQDVVRLGGEYYEDHDTSSER